MKKYLLIIINNMRYFKAFRTVKRISFLLGVSLLSLTLFSQKETNFWYFGYKAGLDFNSGSPVAVTNGQLSSSEGCAAMSDKITGQLLFYTDGDFVWDNTHTQMPNGFGLLSTTTSTQGAIIIPDPGNSKQYYIFTVDAAAGGFGSKGFGGLANSIVDMTLNGGLGDVTIKNTKLITPTTEQVTAVTHCNGIDYWVITHQWNSNSFYAYLVTASGVQPPVVSSIGSVVNTWPCFQGQMKASPNGKMLAWTITFAPTDRTDLFRFNNTTGVISNQINVSTGDFAYGVEFSPDNTRLYVSSNQNGVLQYSIGCNSVSGRTRVGPGLSGSPNPPTKALQLGIDGKIYVARTTPTTLLDVINNPNITGAGCNYTIKTLSLAGKSCDYGLPNFIQSYFNFAGFVPPSSNFLGNDTILCASSYTLDAGSGCNQTYLWSTGATTQTITVSSSGQYWVKLGSCQKNSDTINITLNSLNITTGSFLVSCAGNNGSAWAIPNGGTGIYTYLWNTGATAATNLNLTAGNYTVTVTDADGCNASATASIIMSSTLIGKFTKGTANCSACGCKEWIMVTATGGTAPYIYSWPDGYDKRYQNRLCPGVYSINMKDKNGCSVNIILSVP